MTDPVEVVVKKILLNDKKISPIKKNSFLKLKNFSRKTNVLRL